MNKISRKAVGAEGEIFRKQVDLRRQLNYNYLYLTEQTKTVGEYDIPAVYCNTKAFPDYIALYSQVGYYRKTAATAVAFYQYDRVFDNIHGIYNAIFYGEKNLLKSYKERFKDVRFFISPDYSMFGDIDKAGNINQLKKARIVTLWLARETGAVVIPNLSYVSEDSFETFFAGLEECSVVAVSLKSHVRRAAERNLTAAAVKYAVDNLPLNAIVVYSGCGKDETVHSILKYADQKGIRLIIPNNSLREANRRGRETE